MAIEESDHSPDSKNEPPRQYRESADGAFDKETEHLQDSMGEARQTPFAEHTSQKYYSVDITFDLPPGKRIQVTIDPQQTTNADVEVVEKVVKQPDHVKHITRRRFQVNLPGKKKGLRRWLSDLSKKKIPYKEGLLFTFALLAYFSTRAIHLADFPIYFFCDEAANTVLAGDFIQAGFHNYDGTFFPTYFQDGEGPYCLSVSVYLQAFPYLIFGKSVLAARLIEVLVGVLGAVWLSLMMRDVFKIWFWWSAPIFLAVIPVWFLHSRLSFGYSLTVSFYMGFLYFYSLYRTRNPRFLYLSLLMGAFSFYSYSSGQAVMLVSGLLLLVLDAPYHWQQRKTTLKGLGLLVLLVLPLVRFIMGHPEEYARWFSMYNSYVTQTQPFIQKAWDYVQRYFAGLNPIYWFFPNQRDFPIYTMKGYANISFWMLPFAIYGLLLVVKKFKQSEMRLPLVALLAAPSAAALVEVASRRILVIVVPVVILVILALADLLRLLNKWKPISQVTVSFILVVLLSGSSFSMLNDALVNGPTWFQDYGLDGMQYGATQVYAAARAYNEQHPDLVIYISPNWTFQGNVVREFFVPDITSIRIGSADIFMSEYMPEISQTAFVLMPPELQQIQNSSKFKNIKIDQILNTPDGKPGFYFTRLEYVDNIQSILDTERAERAKLVEEDAELEGVVIHTQHSLLDMGTIADIFDGNNNTVIRTLEANPLVIELGLPQSQMLSGMKFALGSEKVQITIILTLENDENETYTKEEEISSGNKEITVPFDQPVMVKAIHLEVFDVYSPVLSNVHIWEVSLLK